jgi:hypothetical protein
MDVGVGVGKPEIKLLVKLIGPLADGIEIIEVDPGIIDTNFM